MIRKSYSPTAIAQFVACPKRLDFYQQRPEAWRDQFYVGLAAHAFIEHAGLATRKKEEPLDEPERREVFSRVFQLLATTGRSGEAVPFPPDAIEEGQSLAMDYLLTEGVSTTANYEMSAAFDPKWKVVPFDSDSRRFRLVFDLVDSIDVDMGESIERVVRVVDFKTAWSAGEDLLDSFQMRAQCMAATYLYGHDCDKVEVTIYNLRKGRGYTRTIIPSHEADLIDGYREQLEALFDAADTMADKGPRPARPGPSCMTCPFLLQCDEAMAVLRTMGVPETRDERVRLLAVAQTAVERMTAVLKAEVSEGGSVELDGWTLGFHASPKTECSAEQGKTILEAWEGHGGDARGLIEAMKGFGSTQVQAIARRLFPRKKQLQQEWMDEHTSRWHEPRWGFKRIKEDKDGEDS